MVGLLLAGFGRAGLDSKVVVGVQVCSACLHPGACAEEPFTWGILFWCRTETCLRASSWNGSSVNLQSVGHNKPRGQVGGEVYCIYCAKPHKVAWERARVYDSLTRRECVIEDNSPLWPEQPKGPFSFEFCKNFYIEELNKPLKENRLKPSTQSLEKLELNIVYIIFFSPRRGHSTSHCWFNCVLGRFLAP